MKKLGLLIVILTVTLISVYSQTALNLPDGAVVNNLKTIGFKNSLGNLDGTNLIRKGANSLQLNYKSNHFMINALDNKEMRFNNWIGEPKVRFIPAGKTIFYKNDNYSPYVIDSHGGIMIRGINKMSGIWLAKTNLASDEGSIVLFQENDRVFFGNRRFDASVFRGLSIFQDQVRISCKNNVTPYELTVGGTIAADELIVREIASTSMDISGTLAANNITVKANGQTADFVFEKGYQLRDLSEVESFIKDRKHLPDMPSAIEMEEQGVNLAEMNKLLLQKVEELTLYTIELEKKSKLKENQVNRIEAELDQIKNLLKSKSVNLK